MSGFLRQFARAGAGPALAFVIAAGGGEARADDLTVCAAISLTQAFADIAKAYEAGHPGTHVILDFGASDMLLKQIERGAPADVFASADAATMARAQQAGLVDAATRVDFATNALVLIVPADAARPAQLEDLTRDAYTRIAIGNPQWVPAGRYAQQALAQAGLWDTLQPRLVRAQNVRQALDYVARGEAEAGFVYATDAATQTQARKVAVALNVPTATPVRYPAAVVGDCAKKPAACDFVRFLLDPRSRATLARYGFGPATP